MISTQVDSEVDLTKEALRILQEARQEGVTLRLLGGIAFRLRCPSSLDARLKRNYRDIDFVGLEKQRPKIEKLFRSLHYEPRIVFNTLAFDRMIFEDSRTKRRVDIFLGVFRMSHKLNFSKRITLDESTLTLPDLLLTKLQTFEFTEREYKDCFALFKDYELASEDSKSGINANYVARLCSQDWGLYKTFTMNLERLEKNISSYLPSVDEQQLVLERINRLKKIIDEEPKSLRWRFRAKIGEKQRWYELPEET